MLTQLLTAFLGSLGFSLLYRIRGRKLIFAAIGGLLTWGFYLLICTEIQTTIVASALATCFSATYAEVMARTLKAPATMFIIPSIIPLVPGGSLYYAMYAALSGDAAGRVQYGMQTVQTALGIAIGVAAVSSVFNVLAILRKRLKKVPPS